MKPAPQISPAPSDAPAAESSSDCTRQATSKRTCCQRVKGIHADASRSTGTKIENSNPSPSPGSVSRSGRSLQSKSVKINPSSKNESAQYFTVSSENSQRRKQKTKRNAVSSSTSKYLGEIGSPQLRHRPRKTSQLSTGMLS